MNTINAELNLDESDDESDNYKSNESNVCMTKNNNV